MVRLTTTTHIPTLSLSSLVIAKLVKIFKNAENSSSPCRDLVLRSLDWYILPLLNPDGYEFSHSQDRFWRKNRRPPGQDEKCAGVDLNRNFHLGYGLGASRDSCSEVFQGPGPGSEPETAALMSLGERLNTSLLYYVSLHAYGQSWLTPWGFTTEPPANQEEVQAVARAAISQMECSYGRTVAAREYEVGAAADIYYIAGGASDDWFYARLGPRNPRHFLLNSSPGPVPSFASPSNCQMTGGSSGSCSQQSWRLRSAPVPGLTRK